MYIELMWSSLFEYPTAGTLKPANLSVNGPFIKFSLKSQLTLCFCQDPDPALGKAFVVSHSDHQTLAGLLAPI